MANEIDCDGTVNGINPQHIVTLSKPQRIPGTTRIKRLEITDLLEVMSSNTVYFILFPLDQQLHRMDKHMNIVLILPQIYGQVNGRHLNDFLANPDLRQYHDIASACHFTDLIVDGAIVVTNTFNRLQLASILSDIVYSSDVNPVEVPSLKTFHSLTGQITATSSLLNGIALDRYITADTYQEFHLPTLCGNIYFDHLHVNGLFDFLNVTELDQNAIRLSGDQYTEMQLIFEGFGGLPLKVYTKKLNVLKTINQIDVKGFVSVNEDLQLPGNLAVSDLHANEVSIELGDVVDRSQQLIGWDLKRFERFAVLNGEPQSLTASCHINTAVIYKYNGSGFVNGFNVSEVLGRLANDRSSEEQLASERVHVRRMTVEGSVLVEHINGHHLDTIAATAIYLNRPFITYGTLHFLDQTIVNSNLTINLLNSIHFNEFVGGVVRTDDDYVVIKGNTTIDGDVYVIQSLESELTHGFDTKRILSTIANNTYPHLFKIHGDITVPILYCDGYINAMACGRIAEVYRFDTERYVHQIYAAAQFKQLTYIDDMRLHAGFNSVTNATEFVADVVRKDQPAVVRGLKTFHAPVHFETDIQMLDHRSVDLVRFFHNVLFINDGNLIELNGDVHFVDALMATTVNVKGDLLLQEHTQTGVDFDDWLVNAISVNEPRKITQTLIFTAGTFERSLNPHTGFIVQRLNGRLMENVVTLHTPQRFPGTVRLGEVQSLVDISIGGLINAINLTAFQADVVNVSSL